MKLISEIANDHDFLKVAKGLRKTIASIRRRAFIAMLHRWRQERDKGDITMVEVGVKYGGFSKDILTHCPFVKMIYCVDPWEEYPPDHPDREQFGYAGRDQASWDWLYRRAVEILEPVKDRVTIWRTYSVDAARMMYDQMIRSDVVYLDARHAYDDVLEDAREWWRVVADGGLICGDDYYGQPHESPLNWRRSTTGVSQAADDFAKEVGLPLFGQHRSWFVEKPSSC